MSKVKRKTKQKQGLYALLGTIWAYRETNKNTHKQVKSVRKIWKNWKN